MEKEQATGKLDELRGKVKQGIGKVTKNSNLQSEGVVDELKGTVKKAYGDAKDAIKKSDKRAGTDIKGK
jgi:uncharacterized protein YjbJ (UPF0337 family)